MTAAEPDDANRVRELGQRLLLDWRVRCGLRHAAVGATSNADAMTLCVAVASTLERGTGAQELALAACAWASGVTSGAEARAALLCLCDVAAEAETAAVAGMAPGALDIVLEQLAIVAAPAPAPLAVTPARRHQVDPLTGCRGRHAFEADLDDHVSLAASSGADVSVVLAELAPRRGVRARRDAGPGPAGGPDDVVVLRLVAALRRATGSPRPIYRLAEHRFALLLPGTSRARAGEVMLLATCASAPAFDWGAGSLAAAGPRAADGGVVVMLADADLRIRRRDLSHAIAALARRRRASVVTGAAAALVLLGGAAFALDGGPSGPASPALQAALPAHVGPTRLKPTLKPTLTPTPTPTPTLPPTTQPTLPPSAAVPVSAPTPSTAEPSRDPNAAPRALPVAPVASPAPAAPAVPLEPALVTPPATAVPPVPPAPATTTPPSDGGGKGVVNLVTGLLYEAKHAVSWNRDRHGTRW